MEILNRKTGEIETMSEAEYATERDRRLLVWQTAKSDLEIAKEREMSLRILAVDFMADPEKVGKTDNVDLGNGYKAKMKIPLIYSFVKNKDEKIDKARIEKALSKIESDGDAGELIAERLVKWAPSLSLTEYNQLSERHLKIINEVLITSEGTPTLEIVEPKKK